MAAARQRADKHEIRATQRGSGEARSLAQTMPRLILEARRIAATVIHGLHGRRRAGPGENFWQYRRFLSGELRRLVHVRDEWQILGESAKACLGGHGCRDVVEHDQLSALLAAHFD